MKNWLKKVLSLLTAITLLVSAGVLAFAEEAGEPIDTAAAERAAQKNAEEEAARQAAEEEAARKAAEEEAARKAAEEAAARQAAEEAARKAAEEAARKAAEEEARKAAEEAARKAAEEEARKAAEEEAAGAQNANASEQTDGSVPSINNDETSETEVPSDEDNDDSDGEIIEIDGWGYVDPEIIPEYIPEMTTEIKFPEAKALKLNQAVSGSVDTENKAEYILVCGSNKTVVLSLNASSEDVKVEINQKAVKLTKDETVISGFAGTCELNVIAGNEYNIVLTSSVPVSYTLIAKDANAQEDNTAEPENDGETEADEQNEEGRNEQSGSGKPSADINAGINTTEGNKNNANDTADNQETAEEEAPPMKGWISVNTENYRIGDTVILKAESDSELGDMVAWQTKTGSEGSWKGAGYGSTLTVELTEENNNSPFRFKMEDGNFSEEFVLSAAEEKAEVTAESKETEETEETAEAEGTEEPEETEKTEETEETKETEESEESEETEETEESEETEETEETEESEESEETEEPEDAAEETEEITVPGGTKIIVTAEEGADLYISADRESEVTGHLDTGAEAWVILNEEQTWGQICNEDEEAPAQFISMEDAAEVKDSEEAEEEAEEEEEEETETEETAEDEAGKMTAAGCTKIIVTAEDGADLYAEADRAAEVTGHLDAETEVWVCLNEEQTWGQLYNEDEEAAPEFISMEDAAIAETVDEEQMNELGYRKVQVLNQNGTDIYDSPEEEASVIDHAEFESELWIKDLEAEGWAEIYTEEEEIQKYVMLDEIGEQMPFDEEMLEAGYIKVYVAVDIGANVYGSIDGDDIVDHLDAGTELWVKLIDDADRALIFNMDEEAPATYINLVDIIATMKPEDMEDLPAREIVIHDVLKEFGMNVIFVGTEVPLEAELINFSEDDQYTVKWQYSKNGKKFIDIPDANELTFTYVADKDNQDYIWKIVVSLVSAEE